MFSQIYELRVRLSPRPSNGVKKSPMGIPNGPVYERRTFLEGYTNWYRTQRNLRCRHGYQTKGIVCFACKKR